MCCAAREALYVFNGLLETDSVLRLREDLTDTHGYIEDLFGLCYVLGYSFMPRIRDLADQQLYRIDRDAVYPNLAGLFRSIVRDLETMLILGRCAMRVGI